MYKISRLHGNVQAVFLVYRLPHAEIGPCVPLGPYRMWGEDRSYSSMLV